MSQTTGTLMRSIACWPPGEEIELDVVFASAGSSGGYLGFTFSAENSESSQLSW